MKHRRKFIASLFLISFARLVAQSQSVPKAGELQVHATYTGSGTVNKDHKFYVVLWDNPDFRKHGGAQPIGAKPVALKDGVAKFADVSKTPVYVSLAYDPAGKWDATIEPPAGTSLGLFHKETDDPAPIEIIPGKITKISVKFDDSFKMPGGPPK